MWHASASQPGRLAASPTFLEDAAREALAEVGDVAAGEWLEYGVVAVHLRRRLTEAESASVGPVKDIRGTDDATQRFLKVKKYLPLSMQQEIV